jgi:tetratricopeptide (TPR) repeat protein/predicted Ser/Thr protein kinase
VAISSVRARLFGSATEVRIGRYRLERRLGAGGMGEVYLAIDGDLGRRVALKRVRADATSSGLRTRLKQEAQSLAKLNHPNVVQVFEVGEHEGETFLAMEFVEGRSLAEWLREPHRWREVLDVFLAAGRGLAAAHSAGVVHRDFKPDNVLIGDDGRVRVADFGLALRTDREEFEPTLDGELDLRMTNPGGVVGTLRYMPLEQLASRDVDARSDQFAFCVALYEALYGREPFSFDSLSVRLDALAQDVPTAPRKGAPPAIWKVLRRGLRRDPAARWPDIDALLQALTRAARRRRVMAASIAAALVISTAVLVAWPEPERCVGIEHELDGVWDESTAVVVHELFEGSGSAHANDSFERLDRELSLWAAAWTEQRRAQCEASTTESMETAVGWAQRTCLARQRHAIQVLVTQLRSDEAVAVEHVVDVLAEIPDVADCGLERTLEQPEIDADVREQVAALRLELAELRQLRLLGRVDIERSKAVLADAQALQQTPVMAEATAELGKAQIEVGSPKVGFELLEQAVDLALRADHERLLGKTLLDLALPMLTNYRNVALGERYCELADAQWSKLDTDPRIRSSLLFCRARVSVERGEREQAIEEIEAALRELGDGPSPARPAYEQALAQLLPPDAALVQLRAAVDAAEQAWGPEHPHTAVYLNHLGVALLERSDASAREPLERAIGIWTRLHAEPHPDLAWAHLALASLALDAGSLDEAEQHARACAAIQAQTLGSGGHDARGNLYNILSHVASLRGDTRKALAHSLEALSHYERGGVGAEIVEQQRYEVASNLLSIGEYERARGHFEQLVNATSPRARALGQLGLGELMLRRGDAAAALERLEAVETATLEFELALYRSLRALVQLRVGCRDCRAAAERLVAEQLADPDGSAYDLGVWLNSLDLRDTEREVLGPLLR